MRTVHEAVSEDGPTPRGDLCARHGGAAVLAGAAAGDSGPGPHPTRARAVRGQAVTTRAEPHTFLGRALRHPDPSEPTGRVYCRLPAMSAVLAALLLHGGEQDVRGERDEAHTEDRAGRTGQGEPPRPQACVGKTPCLCPGDPDLVRVTRVATAWRAVRHPARTCVLPSSDIRMAPLSHGAGRCPGDRAGLPVTAVPRAEVLRGHRVAEIRPSPAPHGIRPTLTRR